MQSISKIPLRSSSSPHVEIQKDATTKLSLTDQGKAAKLLRKRLAVALATDVKSEMSKREHKEEGWKVRDDENTANLPLQSSPGAMRSLASHRESRSTDEESKRSMTAPKNRIKRLVPSSNTNMHNKERELTSYTINQHLNGDRNSERQLPDPRRDGKDLPKSRIEFPKKCDKMNVSKPADVLETEIETLRLGVCKTLEEFQGLYTTIAYLRKQVQELREDRIRLFSSETWAVLMLVFIYGRLG